MWVPVIGVLRPPRSPVSELNRRSQVAVCTHCESSNVHFSMITKQEKTNNINSTREFGLMNIDNYRLFCWFLGCGNFGEQGEQPFQFVKLLGTELVDSGEGQQSWWQKVGLADTGAMGCRSGQVWLYAPSSHLKPQHFSTKVGLLSESVLTALGLKLWLDNSVAVVLSNLEILDLCWATKFADSFSIQEIWVWDKWSSQFQ